jgi:uncharacterized protein (TIGR03084 family)
MYEIDCLNAEVAELSLLLSELSPPDWNRVTGFKRWSINDIVLHLYASDYMGIASTTSEEAFKSLRSGMMQVRNAGNTPLEEHHIRFPGLAGAELYRLWIEQANELSRRLAERSPQEKLPWAGPSMTVPSFAAARQMENWAHSQAIYDVLGLDRAPTDRLHPIATLGVKTFKWAYVNRNAPVPDVLPQVRLAAPSGASWVWNEDTGSDVIEGTALDFCQVVTQVRNVADTTLRVRGPVATQWMAIAQCFAGAPSDPPAPGTRRKGA